MINGFEEITKELTAHERKVVIYRVVDILKRIIGKSNAITNDEIIKLLNDINISSHGVRIRKMINAIRTGHMIEGLIASKAGYYIAACKEELAEYIDSLKQRESAIRSVRVSLEQDLRESESIPVL